MDNSEKVKFFFLGSEISSISFEGNGKIDVSGEPLIGRISSCISTCQITFDNTTITEEEGSLDKFWMPKKKRSKWGQDCERIIWGCVRPPSIFLNERKVADYKVDLVRMDFGIPEIIKYKPGTFECHPIDYSYVKDGTRWKQFVCTCLPEDKEKFSIC